MLDIGRPSNIGVNTPMATIQAMTASVVMGMATLGTSSWRDTSEPAAAGCPARDAVRAYGPRRDSVQPSAM